LLRQTEEDDDRLGPRDRGRTKDDRGGPRASVTVEKRGRKWAGMREVGPAEGESTQTEAAPFYLFSFNSIFILAFIFNLSLSFEIQAPI
jgi:hypothetical protein